MRDTIGDMGVAEPDETARPVHVTPPDGHRRDMRRLMLTALCLIPFVLAILLLVWANRFGGDADGEHASGDATPPVTTEHDIPASAGSSSETEDAKTKGQDAPELVATPGMIIEFDGQEVDSASLPGPEHRPLNEIGETGFMFASLSDRQRQLYADMLFQMRSRRRMFRVNYEIDYDANESWESLYQTIDAILMEHPELFWICSAGDLYPVIDQVGPGEFFVGTFWNAGEDELDSIQADLDRVTDEYLSQVSGAQTEYDKVLLTYDYVLSSCSYDWDDWENPVNQSIRSSLLGGRTVCSGYARAMGYLLGKVGIPCWFVPIEAEPTEMGLEAGLVTNERGKVEHACDIVCIEGEWYYLDATYGDESQTPHYYMTMTSADMYMIGHDIAIRDIFPECNSTRWDYYHVTGWFISVASADDLSQALHEAADRGWTEAPIKCDSVSSYKFCRDMVDDESWLRQAISEAVNVPPSQIDPQVTSNDTCRTITISW